MSRFDVNVVLLRKRDSYLAPWPFVVLCFSMMIFMVLPCFDILDVLKLLVGFAVSVFLLTQWLLDLKCFLQYTKVEDVHLADACKVTMFAQIVPLHSRKLAGSLTDEIYFDFQKQRFIYSHEKGTFYKLPYPTKETFGYYISSTGYNTDTQIQNAADKWGRNVTEYPQTTFRELLKEHFMEPFVLFEVFCNGLCCLGGPKLINNGLFGFFVLFLTGSLAVISQQKTLSNARPVRADSRMLMVYHNEKWTRVAGTDLVPGDIVSIGRYFLDDTRTKISIPADMLILDGSLIVSESTVTDEFVPQYKVSIKGRRPEEHLSYKRDKRHILFRGTRILNHMPDMIFHIKAPDTGCLAIVLRTGFKTNQGKQIRTCLFSREKVAAKSWERGLFSMLLLFSAIIVAAHLLKKGLENPNKSTRKLLLSYTLSITSAISPELPITLSLAVHGSIWCRKHMKMTLMSTYDSQEEEHYGLSFQSLLAHSAAVLLALARHPVSSRKELMSAAETFILELFNLTKDSILEAKEAMMFLFIAESSALGALGCSYSGVPFGIDICGVDCNLKVLITFSQGKTRNHHDRVYDSKIGKN